jgi:periplasmic mercuric ion binding protein
MFSEFKIELLSNDLSAQKAECVLLFSILFNNLIIIKMKSIQIFAAFMFLFAGITNAQSKTTGKQAAVKTSTFKVWGNCGMCKKTIEGAAKNSGATFASWNTDSKLLTVKYASAKTSVDKIQKSVANAGYDNVKYNAADEAYNELHECCKYDRKTATTEAKACCVKDGKCTGDKDCCKKMDGKADCCANGTCSAEGGCCANMKCEKGEGCCKKEGSVAKSDCCKGGDGKCTHH